MRIDDILSNIEIPDDLNAVVQNSICDAEMYRRKRQRYNRIFASSAAAVFVMFTSLIIGSLHGRAVFRLLQMFLTMLMRT